MNIVNITTIMLKIKLSKLISAKI